MKNRIGVIILVVLCVGLGIALISTKKEATRQNTEYTEKVVTLSNKWVDTSGKLDEQKQVAAMLEKDLDKQKKSFEESLGELTNNLVQVSNFLARTEVSLKTAEERVKERDSKIADLEAQNQALDKQSVDLSAAITNLTTEIASTQRKLASSEGDKAFLEKELHRLLAEKTDLEHQFNDLSVLRAQVSKLKEDAAIARRIEWTRQGIFASSEQKGAQKLLQGVAASPARGTAPRPSNYDLNVEVSADGNVRVIPPVTNAPAATPPK